MGIEIFLSNGYLQLFGISLFVVGFDVFIFQEKIRNKISNLEKRVIKNIEKEYKGKNMKANDVIAIYSDLFQNRPTISNVKYYLQLNLWSGLFFPIACLLGFMLNISTLNESFALGLLFLSGLVFSLSFIILLVYNFYKLK